MISRRVRRLNNSLRLWLGHSRWSHHLIEPKGGKEAADEKFTHRSPLAIDRQPMKHVRRQAAVAAANPIPAAGDEVVGHARGSLFSHQAERHFPMHIVRAPRANAKVRFNKVFEVRLVVDSRMPNPVALKIGAQADKGPRFGVVANVVENLPPVVGVVEHIPAVHKVALAGQLRGQLFGGQREQVFLRLPGPIAAHLLNFAILRQQRIEEAFARAILEPVEHRTRTAADIEQCLPGLIRLGREAQKAAKQFVPLPLKGLFVPAIVFLLMEPQFKRLMGANPLGVALCGSLWTRPPAVQFCAEILQERGHAAVLKGVLGKAGGSPRRVRQKVLKTPEQQPRIIQIIRLGALGRAVVAVDDAHFEAETPSRRESDLPRGLTIEAEVAEVVHAGVVIGLKTERMGIVEFVLVFAAEEQFGMHCGVDAADFLRGRDTRPADERGAVVLNKFVAKTRIGRDTRPWMK